jgi:hypothetical protein
MNLVDSLRYLRLILVRGGLAWLALYALMLFWPSGWPGTLVTRTTRL